MDNDPEERTERCSEAVSCLGSPGSGPEEVISEASCRRGGQVGGDPHPHPRRPRCHLATQALRQTGNRPFGASLSWAVRGSTWGGGWPGAPVAGRGLSSEL